LANPLARAKGRRMTKSGDNTLDNRNPRALRGRAGRMQGGRGSGRTAKGTVRLWGRHAVEAALKNPLRSHRNA
jgi:23S rRNA (guanosine2251-2'-O)-methyltransferase